MKRFNFLSMVVALVLMVTAVSCTTMGSAQDDGYYGRRPVADRVYVDDPYRGTVVLERDPVSGRYYEVNSFGSYGSPYYGSGVYNRNVYRGRTNSRVYRNNNGNYRNNGTYTRPSTGTRPAENQPAREQNREDARKKVLGN